MHQASLLLSLNLFSMLILFPAMMGLDVRRLFAARYDIFCCFGRDSSATDAAILHNANNEKVGTVVFSSSILGVKRNPAPRFKVPNEILRLDSRCQMKSSV